jgi:signal transduction histidine kinase
MCLQRAENHIVLTFRDNGKGFDPDVVAKKDGNGLDSLQRRAKSSCTTLTCTSTINNGTYYKLLIPEL